MRRLWEASWPARWLASARALLRGVRIHPGARLSGGARLQFGRGSIVSQGCVLRGVGAGRITLGEGVWLARDIEMETESLVAIGPRTTIQRRCTLNGTTRLGADCILAPDIFISSGTHPFREQPHLSIREQERRLAAAGVSLDRPVAVQDDCWLGTHVVVCPGVTIGKGSVVGANSVVLRDVPPYSVVAGSPARVIGRRLEWEPPLRVDPAVPTDWPYILAGTAQTAGGAAGVTFPQDGPLLVALAPAAAGTVLRIALRCGGATVLRINGRDFALDPADTELRLQPGPADAPWATLRIEPPGSPASLTFTRFEWVGLQA